MRTSFDAVQILYQYKTKTKIIKGNLCSDKKSLKVEHRP